MQNCGFQEHIVAELLHQLKDRRNTNLQMMSYIFQQSFLGKNKVTKVPVNRRHTTELSLSCSYCFYETDTQDKICKHLKEKHIVEVAVKVSVKH